MMTTETKAMRLVNPDAYDSYNNQQLWYVHDHGFEIAFVFAPNEQEALDEIVDESDHLDHLKIDVDDEDYPEDDDGQWDHGASCGNACDRFDLDTVGMVSLGPVTKEELSDALVTIARERMGDRFP